MSDILLNEIVFLWEASMASGKTHNVEINSPVNDELKLINEIISQILTAREAFKFLQRQPANPNNQKRFIDSISEPCKKIEQIKNPNIELQRIRNFFDMINENLDHMPESIQEIQDCFTDLDDIIKQHMEILDRYTNNRVSRFGIFSTNRINDLDTNDNNLIPPKLKS